MIEINYKDEVYNMKNTLGEINTLEISEISKIFEKGSGTNIDKIISIYNLLGLPTEVSNNLGSKDFIKILKSLRLKEKLDVLPKEIPFGDEIVVIYDGDEYDVTASKMSKIENQLRNDGSVIEVICILLDKEINKENIQIAGEIPAYYTAPYIAWLGLNITESLNELMYVED
jgi:hypothetical protein